MFRDTVVIPIHSQYTGGRCRADGAVFIKKRNVSGSQTVIFFETGDKPTPLPTLHKQLTKMQQNTEIKIKRSHKTNTRLNRTRIVPHLPLINLGMREAVNLLNGQPKPGIEKIRLLEKVF